MAISWSGHIKDVGSIRTQFHHVIAWDARGFEDCWHDVGERDRKLIYIKALPPISSQFN